MAATSEVIELTSGNVAGDYATEQEAIERLRQAYDMHGETAIANLSLMRIENGEQQLIAMQDDLVDLVIRPSASEPRDAGNDAQIVAARRRS